MLKRQEWWSLLGIYALGALLYALFLTPGFMLSGLLAGMGFMVMGLLLGFCGAIIGRRSGHTTAGIIAGYILFIALVTKDFWLASAA
ncbi:MAG: hypothetical protein EA345_05670 [Halomonas sp.]|nr:hypothetical protein [Halomonas sp.]TVP50081.1 MAG: hypothetical protein EA345_05670 [Halomonas sp.]